MIKRIVTVEETSGRLRFVKETESKIMPSGRKMRQFLCQCSCGNFKTVNYESFMRNKAKSCGCWAREIHVERGKTLTFRHGMTRKPEYRSWECMHQRCRTPSNASFESYGGSGMTICERWSLFDNFLEDMGMKPGPTYTLDRINNSEGYSPDNCRWATKKTQSNNRKCNVRLELDGVSKTLAEWARELGIRYETLRARVSRKWSPEECLQHPLRQNTGRNLKTRSLRVNLP